ncbi:MAG TPA: Txe/YoeB family addiction module toxin [Chitinophagaceae bacterium]|nr:Txe/YoeB family addiction module toxin [Chitinophagaceae bacterium]
MGKPEPLKYQFSGCWSRRIDQEHRLIYKINDTSIIVISCHYHYLK